MKRKVRINLWRVWVDIGLCAVFFCALTAFPGRTPAQQVLVQDSIDPVLTVESNMRKEDIVAGNEFTINFLIRNITDKPAFNVTFEFKTDDFDAGQGPFVLKTGADLLTVDQIPGKGTRTVPVTFEVGKDAQADREYRLVVRVLYQNALFQPCGTAVMDLAMPVIFDMAEPVIVVSDIRVLQDTPDLDEGFDIELTLRNTSIAMDARNVVLYLDGDVNFQVLNVTNKQTVSKIYKNDGAVVRYSLKAKDTRTDNTIKMKMTFDYLGSQAAATAEETLNLPLPDADVAAAGNPRVIINKYTLSKARVYGGDRVTLTLYIENTNKRQVENLKISMGVLKVEENSAGGSTTTSSGGTVFSPVDSSNSFYIDRIAGQSVVVKAIELYVDPNAQAKTYIVPIDIVYEDNTGKDLTLQELVNIPVTQEARLHVVSTSIPADGSMGQPIPVMAEYVNTGKVALDNFMVAVEDSQGKFELADAIYYVGKVDIGASDSYSGMIVAKEEGVLTGVLVFSYTDNNNQPVRQEYPFEINVQPAQPVDAGMAEGMPGNGGMDMAAGNPVLGFLRNHWLPLAMAVVALGELIYILRAKKKAREEFFNE
jgi:hypothetical protein